MADERTNRLRIAKMVLAGLAVLFVVTHVPLRDKNGQVGILTVLGSAHPGVLAVTALVYALGFVIWTLRWRTLLHLARVRLPLRAIVRFTLEAQAGGVLLPGGVGGDALRVSAVVERGAPIVIAIASVLLDRAIGLATMLGVAAVLYGLRRGATLDATLLFLTAGPVGFAAGIAVLRARDWRHTPLFSRPPIARVAGPLFEYVHAPGALAAVGRSLLLSIGVSLTQLGSVRALLYALDASPTSEATTYAGTALSFVAGAVPALPGGWGTSDAAFVLFLGRAGVSPAHALGACLLYRMLWYATAVIGAMLALRRSPPPPGLRES
jgi:uncharacterized membrane protein YbhN (UPF0104 family)